MRDVSIAVLPAEAHRLRDLSRVRVPAFFLEHHHGLLGGFGGVRAHLLLGLAHRHQRHCVSFDWWSFRVAGL